MVPFLFQKELSSFLFSKKTVFESPFVAWVNRFLVRSCKQMVVSAN